METTLKSQQSPDNHLAAPFCGVPMLFPGGCAGALAYLFDGWSTHWSVWVFKDHHHHHHACCTMNNHGITIHVYPHHHHNIMVHVHIMFISWSSYCHHDRHHQHHSNWGDGFKLCQDLEPPAKSTYTHHIISIWYSILQNTFLLLWFQYPVGSTWPAWPVQKITSGCVHKKRYLRKSQLAFLQIPVFQHFPPAATSVSQPSNQPSISSKSTLNCHILNPAVCSRGAVMDGNHQCSSKYIRSTKPH